MFASGDAKIKFVVLQCCLSLKVKYKILLNHAKKNIPPLFKLDQSVLNGVLLIFAILKLKPPQHIIVF